MIAVDNLPGILESGEVQLPHGERPPEDGDLSHLAAPDNVHEQGELALLPAGCCSRCHLVARANIGFYAGGEGGGGGMRKYLIIL